MFNASAAGAKGRASTASIATIAAANADKLANVRAPVAMREHEY